MPEKRDNLNVFIPAAGLGERLRPITFHIPKPLLPILGKPVIQYVLDRLQSIHFNKIGLNLHYKKEIMEEWLSQQPMRNMMEVFHEELILGTGGALKNASGLLKEGRFIVHNSDVLTDIDLKNLLDFHRSSKNLVTLAVHDYPKFNNVVVDSNNYLRALGSSNNVSEKVVAFTGIAVYEPEFLEYLPEGNSSVVDGWFEAIKNGHLIGCLNVHGAYWADIGTPASYASVIFEKLREEGEMMYCHASSKVISSAVNGYAAIEKDCYLNADVRLRNCIMLPGSGLPLNPSINDADIYGNDLSNCIVGPDYIIDFDEREVPALFDERGRQLVGTGGSDRKFYRIRKGEKTVIHMLCMSDDPDYERHIEYTGFFMKYRVPVPALLSYDRGSKSAVFEDAGDISLYTYMKKDPPDSRILEIYKRAIDGLVTLHLGATENVSECALLENRMFDYDHFRWETEYFLNNFASRLMNLNLENLPGVQEELDSLAARADGFPKAIIHRDFQSQNIMVPRNGVVRIIDYQGARMGPPAYDVASLLWDPYCSIDSGIRELLLDYYIDSVGDKFNEINFRDSLLTCRLQRHMQALGAYGFLSIEKKKKHFLKFVPDGLRLLKEDISQARDEYPALYKLIAKIK